MKNPLSSHYSEEEHRQLIKECLDGSRESLDRLVRLHQPFIYNVAWKMAHNPNDAMDLTQEVLIKVITKLSQFKFNSSFRTWLYRIVVNEFLQSKRRQGEARFTNFDDMIKQLDAIPNAELNKEEEIELQEVSRDMQIRCMSGMLMCLNREQRLIYILGDTFGIDHKLGADLFNTSPQNFRVKLHRARKDLYNYMDDKCGLVKKSNPCRCPKKAKSLIKMGVLDKDNLQYNISYKHRIAQYVEEEHEKVKSEISEYTDLYRGHATKEDFDKDTFIEQIVADKIFMNYFKPPN